MRILFFGGHKLGGITLKYLINQNKEIIAAVMSDTNKKWYQGLEKVADEYNIDLFKVENINSDEFVSKVRNDLKPDLIISVNFDQIFKKKMLNIPDKGCINIHASLLPKYRGRAPLNWAIIKGEEKTGVTVHFINEGIDTGEIILQEEIEITKDDYISDVLEMVKEKYPLMINKAINLIEKGNYETVKQNKEEGSYYGKRNPEDGLINWENSAEKIFNLIRAVSHPYPGAFTYLDESKILIWKAQVIKAENKSHKTGKVIEFRDNSFLVQCGSNQLLITDFKSETKLKTGDIFNGK
ncbi:methionyl-tRNA formyltransferase [Halanaerobium saccharolyticum]|uniref:Methionyl-tRNA formyltransferase n=1 Tax=Halanaerobium saccharolyticum TaxID=43595 RepID=A0A2T5RFG0_9FIRM|nr:methionyl-tRNA formyltransferase [Halanaerobium saccharolyticum]PTV93029.1 methionyl-tRNA formyltransferase [Halanaerobium saccharolyticum]